MKKTPKQKKIKAWVVVDNKYGTAVAYDMKLPAMPMKLADKRYKGTITYSLPPHNTQ